MKSVFFFSEVPLVLTMFFFLTTQAPMCYHTVKEPIYDCMYTSIVIRDFHFSVYLNINVGSQAYEPYK